MFFHLLNNLNLTEIFSTKVKKNAVSSILLLEVEENRQQLPQMLYLEIAAMNGNVRCVETACNWLYLQKTSRPNMHVIKPDSSLHACNPGSLTLLARSRKRQLMLK